MPLRHSLTYYVVLLHLFLIPLVYFKAYIGPVPLSIEIVLIPALVLIAFYDYNKGHISLNSLKVMPFIITFALFVIVSVISLVNAVNLVAGVMEVARYLSYVLLFLIMVKVNFSKEQYSNFVKIFVASTTLVVVYGALQYIFDFNLNTAGLFALNEAIGRVESTMINPNYYSAFINLVLPAFLVLTVIILKNKGYQLLSFAIFGLLVINMILTYTRVAWLVMFAALALIVVLTWKDFFKNFFKAHLIIAFALLSIFVYNMPDFQSRTLSALYAAENMIFNTNKQVEQVTPEDGVDPAEPVEEVVKDVMTERAMVSRTTLWKTGLVMYRDNPVLGVGMGNYLDRYSDYVEKYPELYLGHERYSVHNSFLKVMAETGTIGIISFLLVYIVYYVYVVRLYFTQEWLGKLVIACLFVGSITFMIQNNSNNLIFIPQMNIIFWMLSALAINYAYTNRKKATR